MRRLEADGERVLHGLSPPAPTEGVGAERGRATGPGREDEDPLAQHSPAPVPDAPFEPGRAREELGCWTGAAKGIVADLESVPASPSEMRRMYAAECFQLPSRAASTCNTLELRMLSTRTIEVTSGATPKVSHT